MAFNNPGYEFKLLDEDEAGRMTYETGLTALIREMIESAAKRHKIDLSHMSPEQMQMTIDMITDSVVEEIDTTLHNEKEVTQ